MKMKKIVSVITSIILILSISISAVAAQPAEINSYEDAYKIALAIKDNLHYNQSKQSFEFEVERAIAQGLDKDIGYQIEENIEDMSVDEASNLNEKMDDIQPQGIVATVVAFLVGAGFGWLADKLLDYGASKFCDAYRSYNKVTAKACDMLGF